MPRHDPHELERFKRDIHLVEFACSRYGYQRDRRLSSASCHVLRHPMTDDKIVVGRDEDDHWRYFSVRDSGDCGSIVDFVQHRDRASLGQVRAELRDWLGTPRPDPGPDIRPAAAAISTNRLTISAFVATLPDAPTSPYLNARGVRPETLQDPRFLGTWKLVRGSTVFLHRDGDGVTGYEIKAPHFTGFAKGGTKTLWTSNPLPDSQGLVLTETGIDALSHAQLYHPQPESSPRYVSTAGTVSSRQLELLSDTLQALPDRSVVVAAFDNDSAGANLTATIVELTKPHRSRGLVVQRHTPFAAKDWNEDLQRVERPYIRSLPQSVRALVPSKDLSR
jgi:hypothetical protein